MALLLSKCGAVPGQSIAVPASTLERGVEGAMHPCRQQAAMSYQPSQPDFVVLLECPCVKVQQHGALCRTTRHCQRFVGDSLTD